MSYFPLMIQLEDEPVLVVGGGETALRKVKILLEFGAAVDVIAPVFRPELEELPIGRQARTFRQDDLEGKFWRLVVAATDDRTVNRAISEGCQALGIPVNVVDDPELCTFIFPAIVKQQEVVCAVSSGGRSPLVAQWVKRQLQQVLPANLGKVNEAMGRFRRALQQQEPDAEKRKKKMKKKLAELLAPYSDQ